ncbi:uncharacterized protein VNE69_10033 [Vairimorpha necatrix]|uniref:Uncharacterized protein n=1 Tax=Vairimorpha necatrix TaxID=6039 RepID=A0AAX4JFK6_9MICR
MHAGHDQKTLKYNINNLSRKGEVYEVSFGQKEPVKQVIIPRKEVEQKITKDIFIKESVELEPEEMPNEVIYEEDLEANRSIFYRYIGKYFLCFRNFQHNQ